MKEIITKIMELIIEPRENSLLLKIKIKLLWLLLIISFSADMVHVHYLASKYHCKTNQLYEVVGFYWLSPVFGLIDLVLSVLIFLKACQNYALATLDEKNKPKTFNFTLQPFYRIHYFSIIVDMQKLIFVINLISAGFVILISILSLLTDVYLVLFHG